MKKIAVGCLSLMIGLSSAAVFAGPGTDRDGKKAKSAQDICIRKCTEQSDRDVDRGGMSRVKAAKEEQDCIKNCKKSLKP